MPTEGVRPPSSKAEHNSTRAAPASSAARTPAMLSMQISKAGMADHEGWENASRHLAGFRSSGKPQLVAAVSFSRDIC